MVNWFNPQEVYDFVQEVTQAAENIPDSSRVISSTISFNSPVSLPGTGHPFFAEAIISHAGRTSGVTFTRPSLHPTVQREGAQFRMTGPIEADAGSDLRQSAFVGSGEVIIGRSVKALGLSSSGSGYLTVRDRANVERLGVRGTGEATIGADSVAMGVQFSGSGNLSIGACASAEGAQLTGSGTLRIGDHAKGNGSSMAGSGTFRIDGDGTGSTITGRGNTYVSAQSTFTRCRNDTQSGSAATMPGSRINDCSFEGDGLVVFGPNAKADGASFDTRYGCLTIIDSDVGGSGFSGSVILPDACPQGQTRLYEESHPADKVLAAKSMDWSALPSDLQGTIDDRLDALERVGPDADTRQISEEYGPAATPTSARNCQQM